MSTTNQHEEGNEQLNDNIKLLETVTKMISPISKK